MSKKMFSVKVPLEITDDQVGYQSIDDFKKLIEYNFKSTLLTCPGELISDPNFGVCLRKALFEMPSSTVISSMNSKIRNQVSQYLPYVTIVNLQLGIDEAKYKLMVRIDYRVSNNLVVETFDLTIDLSDI